MNISINGVNFIAKFEGFRSSPYRDTTGLPTIGYGTIHYQDGTPVKMTDPSISKEVGLLALTRHINEFVTPYLNTTFTTLSQAQFDALCSFCYNLGTGALDKSSLKHAIFNKASQAEITSDFKKWDMAGGVVLAGLETRRQQEANLFITGQYQ